MPIRRASGVGAPVAGSLEMGLVGAAQEWCGVCPADNADPVSARDRHFMRCAVADRLMWQWVHMAVEAMAAEDMAAASSATPRILLPDGLPYRPMGGFCRQCCG